MIPNRSSNSEKQDSQYLWEEHRIVPGAVGIELRAAEAERSQVFSPAGESEDDQVALET